MSSNSKSVLMTEGSIWKHIVVFAIPLFWGNLFQELYTTVDCVIVGNFLGSTSLAAVSSSGSLIFLTVGFFNGIATGSGVIIAKYFGAGDITNLQKALHTCAGFGLVCGIILTAGGVIAAPYILVLMGTPSEVLPYSIVYFRIYFSGSMAFVMYNFFVGILQAVGDSRHPLIYLVISSAVNIILDIISIANVFVQSNINSFGELAVAGCGSYSRIQGFGFLPVTCFSLALTTFISQNLGAREYDRAKKGAVFGLICSLSIAELIGICVYAAAPILIAAFDKTPEVIAFGTAQARTETLFYFLLAFSHCMAGIMRGAGKSTVPMYVMFIFWCIVRVVYITVILRFVPAINMIFWAYPITWALSSVVFLLYYVKSDWIHGLES